MRAQFLHVANSPILASSTILDPRFKKFAFFDQSAADKIPRTIVAQCASLERSSSGTDDSAENSASDEASYSCQLRSKPIMAVL